MQPEQSEALALFRLAEAALRALLDHAVGQPAAREYPCSRGPGRCRPGRRTPPSRAPALVVDAMRHPHVEVLLGADEAGVGDPLAGVAGIVDRALEADREVEARRAGASCFCSALRTLIVGWSAAAAAVVAARRARARRAAATASFRRMAPPSASITNARRARLRPWRARPHPRRVAPRASATPMRRFFSVCGLANIRRSTGLPGRAERERFGDAVIGRSCRFPGRRGSPPTPTGRPARSTGSAGRGSRAGEARTGSGIARSA